MKILLHICCGPCAIFPVESLVRQGHAVTGFFYNPNIHPYTEFRNRLESVKKLAGEMSFEMIYDEEYDLETFFSTINYRAEGRCPHCYRLRLTKTAAAAAEGDFDAFTSTLLVSPYQKHDEIKFLGEQVGSEAGAPFFYEDFRTGFRETQQLSCRYDLYRQKSCGCIFSEYDRYKPRKKVGAG